MYENASLSIGPPVHPPLLRASLCSAHGLRETHSIMPSLLLLLHVCVAQLSTTAGLCLPDTDRPSGSRTASKEGKLTRYTSLCSLKVIDWTGMNLVIKALSLQHGSQGHTLRVALRPCDATPRPSTSPALSLSIFLSLRTKSAPFSPLKACSLTLFLRFLILYIGSMTTSRNDSNRDSSSMSSSLARQRTCPWLALFHRNLLDKLLCLAPTSTGFPFLGSVPSLKSKTDGRTDGGGLPQNNV